MIASRLRADKFSQPVLKLIEQVFHSPDDLGRLGLQTRSPAGSCRPLFPSNLKFQPRMMMILLELLGDLPFERVVLLMLWSMLLFERLPNSLLSAFHSKALATWSERCRSRSAAVMAAVGVAAFCSIAWSSGVAGRAAR